MSRAVTEPHYDINLLWPAEDACWIAAVPELRPCSAHGNTRAEAVEYVNDAIAGWLTVAEERGYPVPEAHYRAAIYA